MHGSECLILAFLFWGSLFFVKYFIMYRSLLFILFVECISQLSTMVVKTKIHIDVLVEFYPWFKFYFPLVWGMLIYDNEFETRK